MTKRGHQDAPPSLPEPGIPGTPGYRTRDNLSGLNPIDTYAESGRMEGLFYRLLFTGRLRTRNPFYLTLMFVGVILVLPSGLAILYVAIVLAGSGPALISIIPMLVGGLTSAIGIALLATLIRNLAVLFSPPVEADNPQVRPRRKKRGLPKRRKDYR